MSYGYNILENWRPYLKEFKIAEDMTISAFLTKGTDVRLVYYIKILAIVIYYLP